MAEKKDSPSKEKEVAKVYRNNGQRVFHLRSREKGKPHFAFEPGDVISPIDAQEEKYFQELHEVGEFTKPGPTAQERINALEKEVDRLTEENAELKKKR